MLWPKNKKFPALVSALLLVVGLSMYYFLGGSKPAPITVDSLSPRAQEFIGQESSDGSGLWSSIDISTTAAQREDAWVKDTSLSTPCFTLSLPSRAKTYTFEESETHCRWEGKLTRPMTHVVIGRTLHSGTLSENSGVILRRQSADVYQESSIELNNVSEVLIFRSSQDVTVFAHTKSDLVTISFTHSSNLVGIDMMSIRQMLDTLTWPTPSAPTYDEN